MVSLLDNPDAKELSPKDEIESEEKTENNFKLM
jgi:NADH-quinone oxidoreductase subunit G